MNKKLVLWVYLLVLLLNQGCLSFFIHAPDIAPSRILGEIEAKHGDWFLLQAKNRGKPNAIAARIDTSETLVLFNGTYRLVESWTKEEIIINESSVPNSYKQIINVPAISIKDNSNGRTYINSKTGKKIMSFGAFLNIDKIFQDNQWCEFIIIDDLAEGYLFDKDNNKFMGFSYGYKEQFATYEIIANERNYYSLNFLGNQ